MIWSRLHWAAGIFSLAAFLSEGVYMRYAVEVFNLDDAPRLIYRSRFLLMMLIGIANLAMAGVRERGRLRQIASMILLLTPLALLISFFYDPGRGVYGSQLTSWTMRAIFAAGVALAIVLRPRKAV